MNECPLCGEGFLNGDKTAEYDDQIVHYSCLLAAQSGDGFVGAYEDGE